MAAEHIGGFLNLVTPKGRIVKGSLTELVTTKYEFNPATKKYVEVPLEANKHRYSFHLALKKSDPATKALLGAMYRHALGVYAAYDIIVEAIKKGLQKNSGFSWKVYDGDAINPNTGKAPAFCEGCYVFPFDTRPPRGFKAYRWDNTPIPAEDVKCGFECDVAFSVVDNNKKVSIPGGASAGLYLNAQCVRYLGTGEEIAVGPSINELMAPAAAPQLGPVASGTVTAEDPFDARTAEQTSPTQSAIKSAETANTSMSVTDVSPSEIPNGQSQNGSNALMTPSLTESPAPRFDFPA